MDNKIEKKVVTKDNIEDPFHISNNGFNTTSSSFYESRPHISIHVYHNTPQTNMWYKYNDIPLPIEHNDRLYRLDNNVGVYIIESINFYDTQLTKLPLIVNYMLSHYKGDVKIKDTLIDKLTHLLDEDNRFMINEIKTIRIVTFIPYEEIISKDIIYTGNISIYKNESCLFNEKFLNNDKHSDKITLEIEAITKTGIFKIDINSITHTFHTQQDDKTNRIKMTLYKNNIPVEDLVYLDDDTLKYQPVFANKDVKDIVDDIKRKHKNKQLEETMKENLINKLINNKTETLKQLTKLEEIIVKNNSKTDEGIINLLKSLKTFIK